LKAAGEVLELEFRIGRPNRYDANMPSAHPHVVCTGCSRIDDVRLDRLGPSVQEVAEQMGYQISGYRLDFYGLCPTCTPGPRYGADHECLAVLAECSLTSSTARL
jgi:Fur family transcriptional regulator, peroxide stress response regulator